MNPTPAICPTHSAPCPDRSTCDRRRLCARLPLGHPRPIDLIPTHRPALHFVGFRGDEYHSAVRVFGSPDVVHPIWDVRATMDIAPGDTVVFAAVPRTFRQTPRPGTDDHRPYDPDEAPYPIGFNDSERW